MGGLDLEVTDGDLLKAFAGLYKSTIDAKVTGVEDPVDLFKKIQGRLIRIRRFKLNKQTSTNYLCAEHGEHVKKISETMVISSSIKCERCCIALDTLNIRNGFYEITGQKLSK